MNIPEINIVMNCYNSSNYLKEALESVLSQSYEDWELIFWDNQSTDNSADIFKSYCDPRFKYHRANAHTTLGEARNLAANEAFGKWIAFMDCDDTWDAEKLELQISQVHQKGEEIGLVYSLVSYLVEDAQTSSSVAKFYNRLKIYPHGAENIFQRLLMGNFIIFSSVMIDRMLFERVGGIDPTLRQNEDFDLLLKVAYLSKAVCVNKECVVYRIHAKNNSHAQCELAFTENEQILLKLPQSNEVKSAIALNYSRYAIYKITQGQVLSGIGLLAVKGSVFWVLKRFIVRVVISLRSINV